MNHNLREWNENMSLSMGLYFEVTRLDLNIEDVFNSSVKTMRFDCAESARAWAREAIDQGFDVLLKSKSSTPWKNIDDPLQCPVCAGYGEPCNETTEDWLIAEGYVWNEEYGGYEEPELVESI